LPPEHYIGINSGTGLSLIIMITSSLNFYGKSGIAHTLISLVSSGSNYIVSSDKINIPFLYSLFSNTEDFKANSIYIGTFLIFDNENVVEFVFITLISSLFYSYFPINNGPKSNIFSDITNTLLK